MAFSSKTLIIAITNALSKKEHFPIDELTRDYPYVTFHHDKRKSEKSEWELVTKLGTFHVYTAPNGPTVILIVANLTPGSSYEWNTISRKLAETTSNPLVKNNLEKDTFAARLCYLRTSLNCLRYCVPQCTDKIVFWTWDSQLAAEGGIHFRILTEFAHLLELPLHIARRLRSNKRNREVTLTGSTPPSPPPKKQRLGSKTPVIKDSSLLGAPKKPFPAEGRRKKEEVSMGKRE